jgi:hypothetical protein
MSAPRSPEQEQMPPRERFGDIEIVAGEDPQSRCLCDVVECRRHYADRDGRDWVFTGGWVTIFSDSEHPDGDWLRSGTTYLASSREDIYRRRRLADVPARR